MDELLSSALETVSRYPVTLDTVAKFHLHGHELGVHCPRGRRWAVIDLAGLIEAGQGDLRFSTLRTRCRVCGERGVFQVRPPAPRPEDDGFYRGLRL